MAHAARIVNREARDHGIFRGVRSEDEQEYEGRPPNSFIEALYDADLMWFADEDVQRILQEKIAGLKTRPSPQSRVVGVALKALYAISVDFAVTNKVQPPFNQGGSDRKGWSNLPAINKERVEVGEMYRIFCFERRKLSKICFDDDEFVIGPDGIPGICKECVVLATAVLKDHWEGSIIESSEGRERDSVASDEKDRFLPVFEEGASYNTTRGHVQNPIFITGDVGDCKNGTLDLRSKDFLYNEWVAPVNAKLTAESWIRFLNLKKTNKHDKFLANSALMKSTLNETAANQVLDMRMPDSSKRAPSAAYEPRQSGIIDRSPVPDDSASREVLQPPRSSMTDISTKDRRMSAVVPAIKGILSKNKDGGPAAHRKTMVDRRVSFALEATMHTWDIVEDSAQYQKTSAEPSTYQHQQEHRQIPRDIQSGRQRMLNNPIVSGREDSDDESPRAELFRQLNSTMEYEYRTEQRPPLDRTDRNGHRPEQRPQLDHELADRVKRLRERLETVSRWEDPLQHVPQYLGTRPNHYHPSQTGHRESGRPRAQESHFSAQNSHVIAPTQPSEDHRGRRTTDLRSETDRQTYSGQGTRRPPFPPRRGDTHRPPKRTRHE